MTKTMTLSTNDFQPDTDSGKYIATILAADIGFSGTRFFRVCKLLKNVSGTYKNVVLSYEINSSGDLMIYSDEPLTGRLLLETDN